MRAPIVSYKHQRDEQSTYIGSAANVEFDIYEGVNQGNQTAPASVPVGSKVANVFVSVNFTSSTGGVTGEFSWMVCKLRAGQTIDDIAPTDASNWSVIGLSNLRNQIFETQGT